MKFQSYIQMDEEPESTPRNGGNTSTSAAPHTSGHLLTSETMNRTAERTCTQKLTIPTLEKQDYTSANMWWRKFVQYIKIDKRNRPIDYDEQQGNTATIP